MDILTTRNFFRSVPRGADACIPKSIIHDWDDERSIAILRNCREANSADSKPLLIERVLGATISDARHAHARHGWSRANQR
jgi:hypothetical protein